NLTFSHSLLAFRPLLRFRVGTLYICSDFSPKRRTRRWVRLGGKAMAISASTPAKSKKMTVASVLKQIETDRIRWVDLQFVDVLGALQHITIPSTSLGPEDFKRGVGKLGGSSIQGFE